MEEKQEKRPVITVPSKVTQIRHKCPKCDDKLFKIKDGIVLCRNSHVNGKLLVPKKPDVSVSVEKPSEEKKEEKKEEPEKKEDSEGEHVPERSESGTESKEGT